MRAILLCAGFATRMYPLTENFPKPLLEIAGKPVLDYLIDQLLNLPKLEEIHVVTNARFFPDFEKWQNTWLDKFEPSSISMFLHNDGSTHNDNRLGAVADLAFVLEKLDGQKPTLVSAGDNIFRFSLLPVWQKFIADGKNYIVALSETNLENLRRTGVLEIGEHDHVMKLHEKPQNPPSSWACPALYFLQPSALQYISAYLAQPDAKDAPGHFIAYLVLREKVYAAKNNGMRFDIGSIASYHEANAVFQKEPVIVDM
ncbi:MAG: nucleotidyltransferase family protein [bacterium]